MCARIGCSASARCVGPRSQPADKPDKLVYWGAVLAVHRCPSAVSIRTAPQSTARLARQTWLIITAEIKERTVNGYMSALRRFIVETHEEFDVPAVTPDRCCRRRRRRRVAVGCCACLHARAGLKLTIVLPNIDSRKIDYRPRAGLGDHRPPHVRQDAQDHQGLREEQAGARPDSGGGAEVPGVLGGLPEGAPREVRHAPRCED